MSMFVDLVNAVREKQQQAKPKRFNFSNEFIQEVKDQTTFEDVLDYFQLDYEEQRSGEYLMFCPFHHDSGTPNLYVNSQKKLYNCYACHAQGKLVNFVMGVPGALGARSYSFGEAIDLMAKISKVKFFEAEDKLVRETDKFIAATNVEEKEEPQIMVLNLSISSILGGYLCEHPEKIDVIMKYYREMDDLIEAGNLSGLDKLNRRCMTPSKLTG